MRKILIIILSCLLCIPAAEAQKKKQEAQKDTIQVPLLNGISINAEVMGLGQKVLKDHGQYEVGVRVNLKDRYFPAFEIGYAEGNDKDNENVDENENPNRYCKVKAPYFRVGMDYNILRNKHDKYRMFVGGRYGFSSFNYELAEAETQKGTYHWLEALIGIDVTVWKMVHLGWDVRWQKQLSHKDGEAGKPWFVPGYGYQKTEVENDRRKAGFTLRYYISIGI